MSFYSIVESVISKCVQDYYTVFRKTRFSCVNDIFVEVNRLKLIIVTGINSRARPGSLSRSSKP